MDRVISLLAALVGLIALGGAILVHTNGETQRYEMAAEIARLKASMTLLGQPPESGMASPSAPVAAAPAPVDNGVTDALLALQDRLAVVERTTREQAAELESARADIAARPTALPPVEVAATAPDISAKAAPAAIVADGPTKDCIPLGTRFMGQSGDDFPICKTHAVVKVASVDEGSAIIEGAGPIAAGGFGNLPTKGCTVMVFSADSSGYAEMRVTCQ